MAISNFYHFFSNLVYSLYTQIDVEKKFRRSYRSKAVLSSSSLISRAFFLRSNLKDLMYHFKHCWLSYVIHILVEEKSMLKFPLETSMNLLVIFEREVMRCMHVFVILNRCHKTFGIVLFLICHYILPLPISLIKCQICAKMSLNINCWQSFWILDNWSIICVF